jgi:intracellular septation protein
MVRRMERPAYYPFVKLAIEAGPLLVFFIVNSRVDIFAGTGAFMAATMVSLIAAYWLERRLPIMPLVTGLFVLVFGGLTLWLHDDLFIKLKPTIINGLFAAILAGGMLFGRPLLRPLLGAMIPIDDQGWRSLTWRWAGWFLFLALFNEVTWRTLPTDVWITTKLFGTLPMTIAFSLAQLPLIKRHSTEMADSPAE